MATNNHQTKDTPIPPDLQARQILNGVAAGVVVFSGDLTITKLNRQAEELCGWQEAELKGRKLSALFQTSEGHNQNWTEDLSILEDNRECPSFLKNRTGATIPTSITLLPLIAGKGFELGGTITFRNETEAFQNRIILASIAEGVFTVDRNWLITSFNRAAEKITGWDSSEVVGRSCSEIFRSDYCGENCPIAMSLYSGQPVASHVITITSKEGRKIPVSVCASPLADNEGNIIGGVETFRDLTEVYNARRQLRKRSTFGDVISKNAAMQRIFEILPEIAHSDSNVLILGESGTGKEILARAIHNASTRKDNPFVAVSCGALPETLLESELFGYKAGAFTDARQDKQGRFAAAGKGTLFLDEIGDIPLGVQVKLLRVLQEKRYEPLGSNRTIEADARIIAATNRNLHDQVQKGLFREDLFYRLNVVRITLPPLRERREDIPLLVQHMITLFSAKTGKNITGISDAALALLLQYDFPGNIREIKNIIEYTFILCPGGLIQPAHLPDPFAPRKDDESLLHGAHPAGAALTLEEMACQTILRSLERHKWKKMTVCRELDISKDTLRRKIAQYQLKNPAEENNAGQSSPTHITEEESHGAEQHQAGQDPGLQRNELPHAVAQNQEGN